MSRDNGLIGSLIALIALGFASPSSGQTQSRSLALSVEAQEMSNWCWAATSKMAVKWIAADGESPEQCRQAEMNPRLVIPTGDTCCPGINAACDLTGWPLFSQGLGATALLSGTPLLWSEVKAEIDANRPVIFAIKWTGGGGGHMLVIRGYRIAPGSDPVLQVIDPLPIANPASSDARLRRGGDEFEMRYDDYRACSDPSRFGKSTWDTFSHWRTYHQLAMEDSAPGGQPRAKPDVDKKCDELVRSHFPKFREKLTEKLGPGGDASMVRLGEGVTFRTVPFARLAAAEFEDGSIENRLGRMSRGAPRIRQYRIFGDDRIISDLAMKWTEGTSDPQLSEPDLSASPVFSAQIHDAMTVYIAKHENEPVKFSGYSFPGINKHFLFVAKDGEPELIPIERDPGLGLVPGQPVTASELLPKLKAIAAEKKRNPDFP